jgi:hypothetical protein
MLKGIWDRWWASIPAFEAREALNQYRVLSVADAGWKIDDRESYIREWQERAEGARYLRVPDEKPGGKDISGEIRKLFGWLKERWGPSNGANDPGQAGFGGEETSR